MSNENSVSIFPHSKCAFCGKQIIFDGACWHHFGTHPLHVAIPHEPLNANARELGVVRFQASGNVLVCHESIVSDSHDELQQIALALSQIASAIHVKINGSQPPSQPSDEVKQLTKAVEGWKAESHSFMNRFHELQIEHMTLRAATRGDVWYYQGDGTDYPESLTCPVVMTAEQFRELLSKSSDV